MTHSYKAIGWNRQKRIYDLTVAGGVLLYLAMFIVGTVILRPNATIETALIRGLGTCAFLLLHIILSIGPLTRIDRRFLPLLYNRRHLGVTMFVIALAHGGLSTFQFHGLGNTNPLVSIFIANTRYASLAHFPFQPLGFIALVILFLMAATSHDFWLANLTAPTWKRLHMAVYVAYGLLVLHVLFGTVQSQTSPVLAVVLGAGLTWTIGIHLVAGFRERRGAQQQVANPGDAGFVDICAADEIPDGRGRTFTLAGDRVAVFRYDGKVSALSNACKHQNGPLGEGRIVNGCIVCPWHGYEYKPENGQSPPPFTEEVPTFNVRVENGRIWVHPEPNPPGTPVPPADLGSETSPRQTVEDDFYVGYKGASPSALAAFTRRAAAVLLVGTATVALLLAAAQEKFDVAFFEFGEPREHTGVVRLEPYPVLSTSNPGRDPAQPRSSFLLVGAGKKGAESEVESLDASTTDLEGTLIYRDEMTMLEVVPDSARPALPSEGLDQTHLPVSLGIHTFLGEIVDAKCYLGVMKPGRGKPHRACAVSCIRGGIPPVLVIADGSGSTTHLILVDEESQPVNQRVLDFVGEPIEVTGEVIRRRELSYLKADPASYVRKPGSQDG